MGNNKAIQAAITLCDEYNPDLQIVSYPFSLDQNTLNTHFNEKFWNDIDVVITAVVRILRDNFIIFYNL